MAWATSAIVLILSLLAMLNTMLMSVMERRSELGVLRAVGWTRGRVTRMIVAESLAISFFAGMAGLFGAWVLCRILSQSPGTSLIIAGQLSFSAVVLGCGAAVLASIVGSLYPAFRAASVLPIECCAMSNDVQDHTHKCSPIVRARILQAVNVCRTYDDGRVQVLANVSLTLLANEYLAIMGPSGSGKSTLLNMLGCFDRPTSGEILFEGKSLAKVSNLDRFRASTLGFVFQSFYLLPTLTAIENVQIPMFASSLAPGASPEGGKSA